MYFKKYVLSMLLTGTMINAAAQSKSLIISANINLPRDTVVEARLLAAINGFVAGSANKNSENAYVLPEYLPETSLLLDEFKDIEKSARYKDEHYYKGYISNIAKVSDLDYVLQIAYIGVDGQTPALRASFTILAKSRRGQYYFYSPLKQNTLSWSKAQYGTSTVFYNNKLDKKKMKAYFAYLNAFDGKLNAAREPEDLYCCESFNAALKLIGVDYKSDYNGQGHSTLSGSENNRMVVVNGTTTGGAIMYDPHDLWHARLHKVIPLSTINKPVDEGTAYLYGGSWGLTWDEIRKRFTVYAAANKNADWYAQYNESKNFDSTAPYPLNVDFATNALLVQQIEQDHGFSEVMALLSCGPKEKTNNNYFAALERITGITKANFNENIDKLIAKNSND